MSETDREMVRARLAIALSLVPDAHDWNGSWVFVRPKGRTVGQWIRTTTHGFVAGPWVKLRKDRVRA